MVKQGIVQIKQDRSNSHPYSLNAINPIPGSPAGRGNGRDGFADLSELGGYRLTVMVSFGSGEQPTFL